MSIVTITFDDNAAGSVDLTTSFKNGFAESSPAHQFALTVLALIEDAVSEVSGEEVVDNKIILPE